MCCELIFITTKQKEENMVSDLTIGMAGPTQAQLSFYDKLTKYPESLSSYEEVHAFWNGYLTPEFDTGNNYVLNRVLSREMGNGTITPEIAQGLREKLHEQRSKVFEDSDFAHVVARHQEYFKGYESKPHVATKEALVKDWVDHNIDSVKKEIYAKKSVVEAVEVDKVITTKSPAEELPVKRADLVGGVPKSLDEQLLAQHDGISSKNDIRDLEKALETLKRAGVEIGGDLVVAIERSNRRQYGLKGAEAVELHDAVKAAFKDGKLVDGKGENIVAVVGKLEHKYEELAR